MTTERGGLPAIPDEAINAGRAANQYTVPSPKVQRIFEAAWPHLYAAALRHAAGHLDHEDRCAPDECLCNVGLLRAMADEAVQ